MAVDELVAGSKVLRRRFLAKHITESLSQTSSFRVASGTPALDVELLLAKGSVRGILWRLC